MGCILICTMKRQPSSAPSINPQVVSAPARAGSPRRISSASLLQGQRHVVIEHVGREYRLHLTANGKLILTG